MWRLASIIVVTLSYYFKTPVCYNEMLRNKNAVRNFAPSM